MGMETAPAAFRRHITLLGKRNAGKSSLINAITGQELSIVSDIPGTTTDPVQKSMEVLPLGPVVFIDTPGLDDEGELGTLRVEKAYRMLDKTDIAVIVLDAQGKWGEKENSIAKLLLQRKMPMTIIVNKIDLVSQEELQQIRKNIEKTLQQMTEETAGQDYSKQQGMPTILFASANQRIGIDSIKETLARLGNKEPGADTIICDRLHAGDVVVLVIPIDESAPKGRLILPQQMVLRELLDHRMIPVCCQGKDLAQTLDALKEKPKLVITDSQAFGAVNQILEKDILLTSFSILMARWKKTLEPSVKAARLLEQLQDGDKLLIAEGCTHHRQCGDIGTVKLPAWIEGFSGKKLQFSFTSGTQFPDDLNQYRLIVHCGGCMLNEAEMGSRYQKAREAGIPITNYGIAIAHINGILKRSLAPLGME